MELIVVVLIIGVLVAIAIPSYQQFVVRSNRTEARAELLEVAQSLERCFTRFNGYDAASGCLIAFPITSETGLYIITAARTATTYTLTATPQGAQATRDTRCANYTLNQTGVRGVSGPGGVGECW